MQNAMSHYLKMGCHHEYGNQIGHVLGEKILKNGNNVLYLKRC